MTKVSIDPSYLPLLELLPSFDLSNEILPQLRQQMAAMTPPLDASDTSVSVQELFAPSGNGSHQVRVLLYRDNKAGDNCPALLEIHGGGHILGSADMGDVNNRELAKMIVGVVVSVDYRLAPETPYPGPIEDCYSTLLWLFNQASNLNIDSQRIGIIGTSAGGGLAACLALMARDKGVIPLAFQGLIMPMLDNLSVAREAAKPSAHVGQFLWTSQANGFAWQAMLGNISNDSNVPAYAAAARASNVGDLPPTYIGIGALDLFAEESLQYAQRLIMSGVSVDCHVYAGTPHGYNAIPDAQATTNERLLLQQSLTRAFNI